MTLSHDAGYVALTSALCLAFAAPAWSQARKSDLPPPANETAPTSDGPAAEAESPGAAAVPEEAPSATEAPAETPAPVDAPFPTQPANEPPPTAAERPATADTRLTVMVLPLVPKRVDPALAATVDALVAATLGVRAQLKLITMADLNALLTAERLKDLFGCDDVTCSSEVSGAVGADRILAGSLGRLGDDLIVELTWIDAEYSVPLAHVAEVAPGGEGQLPATVRSALARLLDDSAQRDEAARVHKSHPTFWTAELGLGPVLRQGSEPYETQVTADLRLAWGGKSRSTGIFFYGVGGLGVSYFGGSADTRIGHLSYERTELTPFLEARLGIPIDVRERVRVYVGAGAGLDVEWYQATQTGGIEPRGTRVVPELRAVAGGWYRWRPSHSFFGQYVGRLQLIGNGADSISELAEQRSTRARVSIHAFELGWALHF